MDSFPPILLKPQLCWGWEEIGRQFYWYHLEGPNTFDLHCSIHCRLFLQVWKPCFCLCNYHIEFQKSCELGKIKRSGEGEGKRSRNIRQQSILDSSLCYIRESNTKSINQSINKTCSDTEASKLTQVNLDPVLLPSFWGQLLELAHPELQSTTALLGIWLCFH